mgnify:CR=1 FL=1
MVFVFCVSQENQAEATQKRLFKFILFLLFLNLPLKGVQNYCLFIDFQKVYAFKIFNLEKNFLFNLKKN